ncbi:Reverse transcriptase domain [Arabidopsis suecica]|uniref:Reverse transcriptase domain n=1 Tax=Arabidopsis suecica TaxID=45249 RepID=A0A8T1ZF67_ARASU|nr:Reverse transcriptase domain [Arabidopsis suecica]
MSVTRNGKEEVTEKVPGFKFKGSVSQSSLPSNPIEDQSTASLVVSDASSHLPVFVATAALPDVDDIHVKVVNTIEPGEFTTKANPPQAEPTKVSTKSSVCFATANTDANIPASTASSDILVNLVKGSSKLLQNKGFRNAFTQSRVLNKCLWRIEGQAMLQKLQTHVLSPALSAFLPGRLLDENVLLATEIVHGYNWRNIESRGMLKVDLRKAFDSVRWDFIISALRAISMPERFLWFGSIDAGKGAKIAWSGVCLPKKEGGVGLRRFSAWNKTFCLRFIWLLFVKSGSLGAAWHKTHYIKKNAFWLIDEGVRDPWTWKMLFRLRPLAERFLKAHVFNGEKVFFCFDNWTPFGPLIKFIGTDASRSMRIPAAAKVSDACNAAGWIIPPPKSGNALLFPIMLYYSNNVPSIEVANDSYSWDVDDTKCIGFSTSKTWEAAANKAKIVLVGRRSPKQRKEENSSTELLGAGPAADKLAGVMVSSGSSAVLNGVLSSWANHLASKTVTSGSSAELDGVLDSWVNYPASEAVTQ